MAKQLPTRPPIIQDNPVVPVGTPEPKAGPLARFVEGLPPGWFFSSFPMSTPEQVARAMYEVEVAVHRLWDRRGSTLLVRDVAIVMSDEEDEETGEVKMVKRLVIWDHKGIGFQTPSKPARNSLGRQLARIASPPFNKLPPYDPPLAIRVDSCKSANAGKGDWLHLVVLMGDKADGAL